MRSGKLLFSLLIIIAFFCQLPVTAIAGGQRRRRPVPRRKPATKLIPTLSLAPTDIKVLTEAQRVGVPDPFVGVAYNADTYKLMREIAPEMPDVNAEVFKSRAVVAVFLGRRPTAGYAVNIEQVADGLRISERTPAPGTMVAQVLTSPLKVVSFPTAKDRPLNLHVELARGFNTKDYRLSEGEFSYTGGFAGRQTKYSLGGTLRIWRHEKFVSVLFNLEAAGAGKARSLQTVATGVVDAQGNMLFGQVDPGTLIEFPYAPLRAEGSWADHGVWFKFESLPPTVADAFEGKGTFKAQEVPIR